MLQATTVTLYCICDAKLHKSEISDVSLVPKYIEDINVNVIQIRNIRIE